MFNQNNLLLPTNYLTHNHQTQGQSIWPPTWDGSISFAAGIWFAVVFWNFVFFFFPSPMLCFVLAETEDKRKDLAQSGKFASLFFVLNWLSTPDMNFRGVQRGFLVFSFVRIPKGTAVRPLIFASLVRTSQIAGAPLDSSSFSEPFGDISALFPFTTVHSSLFNTLYSNQPQIGFALHGVLEYKPIC